MADDRCARLLKVKVASLNRIRQIQFLCQLVVSENVVSPLYLLVLHIF